MCDALGNRTRLSFVISKACRDPFGGRVPRLHQLICLGVALLIGAPLAAQSPSAAPTDLDALMARALQRRDVDRRVLSDYILDELENFEVLGPGRAPITRLRREYTWYVRDGMHVRSPVKFNGVPISEEERRAYETRWMASEKSRQKYRAERAEKRESEGKAPAIGVRGINEPRFISEAYFLEFKFEPGNYYLEGHEQVAGRDVLKIDYYPKHLFTDEDENRPQKEKNDKPRRDRGDEEIDRKMNKTAQVTLWVDPVDARIVKYTFDNVWMDFLPAGWLVKIDDLHASMEMGQPFDGVWLPKDIDIHGTFTLATGPIDVSYRRDFSNYRRADVTTRITVPKEGR
jgi:hypothetical protein